MNALLYDEESAIGKAYILHDPADGMMSVYGNAESAVDRAVYELCKEHDGHDVEIDVYDYVIYVTTNEAEITILIEDIRN